MTGFTADVASTSRPAPAHARSPRPRRRRANPGSAAGRAAQGRAALRSADTRRAAAPTGKSRLIAAARLALPPITFAWGAITLLFAGFVITVAAMFAAANPGSTPASDPVAAVDDALGTVAADSGALAPAFTAVPALIALVHLAALVLAVAVLVRRRVGLVGRVTAGAVLVVVAAAAVPFWAGVIRTPEAPGPDVVAWVTVFLVPTVVVLVLELAVKAPGRAHRGAAEAARATTSTAPSHR